MSDIVAKLADGTELRFPAGTADGVVDTTVQNYLADPANQVAASPKSQAPVAPTGPEGAPIPPVLQTQPQVSEDRPIVGSAKKGIVNLQQTGENLRLANLMELQDAYKQQYGQEYEKAPQEKIADLQKLEDDINTSKRVSTSYDLKRQTLSKQYGITPLSQKLDEIQSTPEYQNASGIQKFQTIGETLTKNPGDIPSYIANIGLESLPNSMAMMASAVVARYMTGSPSSAAAAGGATSSFTEFGNQYVNNREQGKSHQDAMAEASVKSGIIGYFDAVSFGSAGKALEQIIKEFRKGAIKSTAKEVVKETGKQAGYGAAGETVGSVATGQPVDPRAVVEEALGEIAGAPMEAVTTYRSNKALATPKPPPVSERIEPEVTPREPSVEVGQPTIVPSPEIEAYDKEIAKAQPTETKVSETSHDTQAMMDELSGKSVEYIPEPDEIKTAEPKPRETIKEFIDRATPEELEEFRQKNAALDMSDEGRRLRAEREAKAKEEAKPEVLYSVPMGENTEYHVLKNDLGHVANLYDKDAGRYVADSARIFPVENFGAQTEAAAKNFVKEEQNKAAAYDPSIKEEPTGVITEEEKEFTPVGGRLINKADVEKIGTESKRALEQNLATQEAEKEATLKREIREEKFREPVTQTLSARLVELKGIAKTQKRDMLGETGKVEGYNHVFKDNGGDLLVMVKDGLLDNYLPPILRAENSYDNPSYDERDAYNYISDLIKTGEKVHHFDYEMAKIQHENMVAEKDLAKEYMEPNEAARAAAAEIQGKEYMNVEPSKEVIPTPSETKFHEDAKTYVSEVPDWYFTDQTPSFKIEMNKLRRRIKQGSIKQEDVILEIESIYQATKKERPVLDRQRGAAIIKEKLLAAKRRKELSPEMVDMAEWFINKNPDLVQDLAVSVTQNKRDGVSGGYLPLSKLAKIFKYSPNDMTAVHEMLHHTERMLPTDIQDAIRKAWSKSLQKDSERAFGGANESLKEYYKNVIDYHTKGKKEYEDKAMQMLADNVIPYEHYKNFNPSEFWATKGSEIVQGRYKADISDSIVAKIKNWLKEFIETVKGIFNISDDAAVIKALNSLAKSDGKFITDMIHADTDAYNVDVIKAQPKEYLNIERKAPHEFEKSDISEDAEEYTIPANTELYHGAHGDRANEILESGSILKARPPITSGGGMLFEGDLVWFGDKRTAKGHAASAIDTFAAAGDREAGRPRKPGKVFGFITDKPLKLINRTRPLTAEEAAYFNKVFRIDEIYDGHKNLKEGEGVYKAAWRAHDGLPYDKKTYRTTPWPIILKHLGYDGYFDDSGIALNIGDVKTKLLDNVEIPIEKEYLSIGQPPKNFKGQEVIPQWNAPEESKVDYWLYRLQDKQIDAKRVQQMIEKNGKKIEDDWNFYEKEQLFHGRTASGIRKFLLQEVLPAAKEMQRLNVTPEEIHNYLLNRHAEERNIQMNEINPSIYDPKTNTTKPNPLKDQGSGVHTDDARKYLANLDPVKKKHLEDVAKSFDRMIKGTQGILMNSGAETADTIRRWNQTYKNYVPLMRKEDASSKTQGMIGTGQGLASRGSFSKRALGSLKEHEDILGNIIAQRERSIIRAEKIRVGRALYGLAIQNPSPDFWLPVNPDAIRNKKQVVEELKRLGITNAEFVVNNLMAEPKERYLKKVNQLEGKEPEEEFDFDSGLPVNQSKEIVDSKVNVMARYKDNVFPVRIDGKDRFIFFNMNNPRAMRMVQAIKNLDVEELGMIESIAGRYTLWFKNVNTQYNPVFGLKNFIRDYSAGSLNLTSTPINGMQAQITADMMPAMRGIWEVLRNERKGITTANTKYGRFFKLMRDYGFQTGYRESLVRNQEEMQIVNNILEGLNKKGITANTKKAFSYIAGGLTDFNDIMENSIRLATAKAALDRGLSPQQAAIIAKNITVNFDKKGAKTRQIGALYAFFNPAVQGTERIYQTLKGPAKNYIIGGGILAGMIQAVMMAMAGYDDEDPPEFTRQKAFVVPMPDGHYFPIPYPQGYNILPNVGRITMDFIINGGKNPGKHVANLTGAIMDSLSPLGTIGWSMQSIAPTALDPFAAIKENRDAFNRPIARLDRDSAPTPGYSRSRDTASILSKGIAEFLNSASFGDKYVKGAISPTGDQLDFLAGQVGGGLYREASKAVEYAKSKITGEEVPAYRVPIVGQFHGEVGQPAAIANKFYQNVIRMTDHENTIKGLKEDKLPKDEYMAKYPEAKLWHEANTTENRINQINKQKREDIKKNKPKEVIQRHDEKKTRIMKEFNDKVKRLTPD